MNATELYIHVMAIGNLLNLTTTLRYADWFTYTALPPNHDSLSCNHVYWINHVEKVAYDYADWDIAIDPIQWHAEQQRLREFLRSTRWPIGCKV